MVVDTMAHHLLCPSLGFGSAWEPISQNEKKMEEIYAYPFHKQVGDIWSFAFVSQFLASFTKEEGFGGARFEELIVALLEPGGAIRSRDEAFLHTVPWEIVSMWTKCTEVQERKYIIEETWNGMLLQIIALLELELFESGCYKMKFHLQIHSNRKKCSMWYIFVFDVKLGTTSNDLRSKYISMIFGHLRDCLAELNIISSTNLEDQTKDAMVEKTPYLLYTCNSWLLGNTDHLHFSAHVSCFHSSP